MLVVCVWMARFKHGYCMTNRPLKCLRHSSVKTMNRNAMWETCGKKFTCIYKHRGQTFAHARVFVRAELSARTKTEEKYISECLHKALEKRVNKITRG